MAALQDELNRQIKELCADTNVRAKVLRICLANRGIALTEPQFELVVDAVKKSDGSASINVDIDGFDQKISLTPEEIDNAHTELAQTLEGIVGRVINDALTNTPPRILKTLSSSASDELGHRRAGLRLFEERLYQRWQLGLDKLEMLIAIADESSEWYATDHECDSESATSAEMSALLEVLVALHSRACRTAREILCLLKAGFPDGANARWRSLHEVAITAFFLLEHQGDVPQRYLDHAAIEKFKAARHYQKHCDALGFEPLSDAEFEEIKLAAEDVIVKYGEAFKGDYGWAAHVIGSKRPTFTDIEANVDFSNWRPMYGRACQSVHAGSNGLYSLLAIPLGAEVTLVPGPSNAGLADPGQHTAQSLVLTTVALLTASPTLDGLVACKCLLSLSEDVRSAFLEAHNKLDREMQTEPPTNRDLS